MLVLGISVAQAVADETPQYKFPRIANMWGTSIPSMTVLPPTQGSAAYDTWAKYDLVVVSGVTAVFSSELRKRNPKIKILSTGTFTYTGTPQNTPWMKNEWFLRRPSGEIISWWGGVHYIPNLMIDDCLQAMVENKVQEVTPALRNGVIDGIFCDTVLGAITEHVGDEIDSDRK